jgi:cytochrome P450 family 13
MLVIVTLLGACLCLFVTYIWRLKSRYDYFVRRNIPGPPFQFFFGHYRTLWNTHSYTDQIKDWSRQFGAVYGLFEGSRPMYIVSDVDFLQEVFIKQFSSFHSCRGNILNRLRPSSSANLFSAHANQWRRQRYVINPTFTTLKLKTMAPLMTKCIESLMTKLSEMGSNEFNIYEMYKRLTMDVICKYRDMDVSR